MRHGQHKKNEGGGCRNAQTHTQKGEIISLLTRNRGVIHRRRDRERERERETQQAHSVSLLLFLFFKIRKVGKKKKISFMRSSGCLRVCVSHVQDNGAVKMLPRQQIHTQQYKNYWTRCFLCSPYCIKYSVCSERKDGD
jgi:hypothetical protein